MNKKTLIIIGGSVIGIFIVLIFILWLVTNLTPTASTYEEIENYMAEVAEKYYKDNAETMPSEDGTYSLDYNTLVNAEYAEPLSEYVKEGVSCTGKITIIKSGIDFSYFPYLNCGDEYQTKELYKQILSDNPVVTTNSGLYQASNGEYYFKGQVENNYVSFGTKTVKKEQQEMLWRIISIKDNVIKLRAVEALEQRTEWDTEFNADINKRYGYNDFEKSIIKTFFGNLNKDNSYLSASNVQMLVARNICIGSRTATDTSMDGSSECSVLSTDKYYFTTLLPYEYMRASLDPLCTTIGNRSCSNLNYLYDKNQFEEWTTVKDPDSSYQVYLFNGVTHRVEVAKYKEYIYPVIELNAYSFYESGDGSKTNPYLVRQVEE